MLSSKRFAFFLFTSTTRDRMSANYRCSSPPPPSAHQQYLDINRRRKKKKEI